MRVQVDVVVGKGQIFIRFPVCHSEWLGVLHIYFRLAIPLTIPPRLPSATIVPYSSLSAFLCCAVSGFAFPTKHIAVV